MIFGNNHAVSDINDLKQNYDNVAIERVDKFKYMGVWTV